MDCTYKTNRFKMPLLIIGGQTALHTTFYVAFYFMHEETNESYIWAMTRLKVLYSQLELSSPTTTVTDMDRGLMSAFELILPSTSHLLCIWHINKNVLAHCKKSFSTEAWEVFYGRWKSLIKADSEPNFEELWGQFRITYNRTHANLVKYLNATYISFRQRFVKCWTDRVRHIETTTTSRGEGGHAVLKRQLGTSNGDLKAAVDGVALLLTNELHNHLIAINSARIAILPTCANRFSNVWRVGSPRLHFEKFLVSTICWLINQRRSGPAPRSLLLSPACPVVTEFRNDCTMTVFCCWKMSILIGGWFRSNIVEFN